MDDHVLPRLFSSAIWTRGLLAVLLAANLCAPVAAAETPTAMGFLDSARARTSRLESVHLSADFQIRRLATNSGLETGLEGTFEYWSAGGKSRTEIRFDGRRPESFGNIAVASDGRSVEVFFPDLDLLVQRSAAEPRPPPACGAESTAPRARSSPGLQERDPSRTHLFGRSPGLETLGECRDHSGGGSDSRDLRPAMAGSAFEGAASLERWLISWSIRPTPECH